MRHKEKGKRKERERKKKVETKRKKEKELDMCKARVAQLVLNVKKALGDFDANYFLI
jgi:hypothetical protein